VMVEPFNGVGYESGRRNRGAAHRFGEGEAEQALGGTSFLGAAGHRRMSRRGAVAAADRWRRSASIQRKEKGASGAVEPNGRMGRTKLGW
jgi:hypothetical protein